MGIGVYTSIGQPTTYVFGTFRQKDKVAGCRIDLVVTNQNV